MFKRMLPILVLLFLSFSLAAIAEVPAESSETILENLEGQTNNGLSKFLED